MAAPLGFKSFATGDVLTAADTNGYLMQGIWVFANAAARDAAVTSPQEGNSCYLKDTDVIQVYSGSAWVTKSGSSPLTTKGDLYTYSTTDTRLGVGANDTVLTADSTAATGLKWGTVSAWSPNYQLLNSGGTTLSGTTTTVSGISGKNSIYVQLEDASMTSIGYITLRLNGDSGSNYAYWGVYLSGTTGNRVGGNSTTEIRFAYVAAAGAGNGFALIEGTNTAGIKPIAIQSNASGTSSESHTSQGKYIGTSAITSVSIVGDFSFDAGKVYVYGA